MGREALATAAFAESFPTLHVSLCPLKIFGFQNPFAHELPAGELQNWPAYRLASLPLLNESPCCLPDSLVELGRSTYSRSSC